MADAMGPNRYLPGYSLKVKAGMCCDDHPDRPATHRVVGETDSFGSELLDLCDECFANMKEVEKEETLDPCDICHTDAILAPCRDPDEGLCGRVYYACPSCRTRLWKEDS